jgi:hypothetical protein
VKKFDLLGMKDGGFEKAAFKSLLFLPRRACLDERLDKCRPLI